MNPIAPARLKFIFNPRSRVLAASPDCLQLVLAALQSAGPPPEVYRAHLERDTRRPSKNALRRGCWLFVVCGRDGSLDAVVGARAKTIDLGLADCGGRAALVPVSLLGGVAVGAVPRRRRTLARQPAVPARCGQLAYLVAVG